VPVPTAVWMFGSGFLGLIGIARKKAAQPFKQHHRKAANNLEFTEKHYE
jgi:hypothetical protein